MSVEILQRRYGDAVAVLDLVRRLERQARSNPRKQREIRHATLSVRAGVYVMIYNAVEFSVRAVLESIRSQMQAEGVVFSSAVEFWQLDSLYAAFMSKMTNGTNHGQLLKDLIPHVGEPLSWHPKRISDLPLSGNFGQDQALELADRLSLRWRPPAGTAGGSDLEIVRARRNGLSHGFESYEAVGGQNTTNDVQEVTDRTRVFMVSLLTAMERYRLDRSYLRSAPTL